MSGDPSWKHSRGSAAKRPAASRKSWQQGKASGVADPHRRARRVRMAAAFVGALLVSGIVLAIILWRPTKAARFVVVSPNIPINTVAPLNAAGFQSANLLTEWAVNERDVPNPKPKLDPGLTVETWESAIDRNDSGKSPLVLHFTAPGGSGPNGPFLWMVPEKATVAEPSHRLPVAKILDMLKTLPASRPKVLIFDAAFESVNWTRGEFSNEFARGLKSLDAKIAEIDGLVVICSADADQTAWVSEEWLESVFGHFLVEGLRGGAGQRDQHVTVAALLQYLDEHVGGWAQANRDAPQKPFLLPSGDGPRRAEQIRLISVHPANTGPLPPGSPPPGVSTEASAELRKIWDRTAELAARQPRPEAASPNIWRQYLDLAMRCEKLARHTGTVPAAGLARLTTLERELTQSPWNRTPECLANALPVSRAMGQPVTKLPPGTLDKLLALPAADQPKEWDKQTGPREATSNALAGELLEKLAKQETVSPADLDAAIGLLKQLDALRDRQTEVQLLRILHAEKTRKMAGGAEIALALKIHLAGERCAWFTTPSDEFTYPEQVARWLSKPLAAADENRRTGIDLLFSGDAKDWAKGRERLTTAGTQYDALQAEIAKLATALRVRDELQTRLPYYAFWVANQRTPAADTLTLLTAVEGIAGKFHELAALLANPSDARLEEINRITALLDPASEAGSYATLVKRFQKEIDELALSTTQLASDWHRLDNALRVPFISPTQRAILYRRERAISVRLHTSTTSQQATPSEFSARTLSIRHGRMALAVLGAGLADELKSPSSHSWAQLGPLVATADSDQWAKTFTDVGEQLAAIYRSLPALTAQAHEAGSRGDGDTAKKELARACRLVSACDGTLIPAENPFAAERRVWMHALLLAQAKRSINDGWAEVDAGAAKPYCRRAAEAYCQTAEDIIINGEPLDTITKEKRLADAAMVRTQLIPPMFTLTWEQGTLDLTDRPEEKPKIRVVSQRATGFPVMRVLAVSKPLSSNQFPVGQGAVVSGFEKPDTGNTTLPVPLTVDRETVSGGAVGQVDAELFFRGRREVAVLKSQSFGQPTYTWIHRTPKERPGMVSVSGDESLMSGSVAILFDASASMDKERDVAVFGSRKYVVAADAVRELLARLPKDAYVSVTTFAQNKDGGLTLNTLQEPRLWNEPERFSKALHAKLVNTVNFQEGYKTPIAEAMIHARDVANQAKYFKDGFKNLIVITDGDDNVETGNPGERVVNFIKSPAQANTDVAMHIVLFGATDEEEKSARSQFKPITNESNFTDSQTPGEIWPREGGSSQRLRSKDELRDVLRAAMLPRVQLLSREEKRAERVPVSLAEENTHAWLMRSLVPGLYTLRTADESRQLQVQPGDRLALVLKREAGKLVLSLPSYVDARRINLLPATDSKSEPLRMTVPLNRRVRLEGRDDAEMFVTLEKPLTNRADNLRRELPLFAWFEVTPDDGEKQPTGIRVENIFDRIAPTWVVTAHTWVPRKGQTEVAIAPAHPKVEGYWLDRMPEQDGKATLEFKSLNRLGDELAKMPSRKFGIQGVGEITLDDIAIEGRYLTVRLKYPKGSPVVPRAYNLLGVEQRWTLEEEHRWYGPAGVCVSRFGPLPEDLAIPLTLDVYSLDAIKRTARKQELVPKDEPDFNARDIYPPKRELPKN
ncbi:vWA domain-containing protein [Zavarzinella formosa]|uniref:vWA domain-containing protein n=1 Tax=Zavarzinella formosa TaxID=360055 RepID=UPI000307D8F5|nr:vWA domain-containing protein [Zavarzinella formosa]